MKIYLKKYIPFNIYHKIIYKLVLVILYYRIASPILSLKSTLEHLFSVKLVDKTEQIVL